MIEPMTEIASKSQAIIAVRERSSELVKKCLQQNCGKYEISYKNGRGSYVDLRRVYEFSGQGVVEVSKAG